MTAQFCVVPEPAEFGPLEKQCFENLSICDYINRDHISIWVMKDYGVNESWSKDIVITRGIYAIDYELTLMSR